MNKFVSIFNDVIGPVMRGPSSSHTAASWRIARICLEILNEPLKTALIEFDVNGAWASNYLEQGTVMGINGGLLALNITDDAMKNTEALALQRDVDISYAVSSFPTKHTNTVKLNLQGINGKKAEVVACSIGGGSFEIQQIDTFDVSIRGNYYELLIWQNNNTPLPEDIKTIIVKYEQLSQSSDANRALFNLKSSKEFPEDFIYRIKNSPASAGCTILNPILPIVSGNETALPFQGVDSMLEFAEKNNCDLGDIGLKYEKYQSGLSAEILSEKMENIILLIEKSIETGLKGTVYEDRILPQQSHLIAKAEQDGKILNNSVLNSIIANVAAIMESKSANEVVVANPTAGSCGAVGAVLKSVAEDLGSTPGDVLKAYFAAGIVGVYFAYGPGFSAEECGCQVECGASAGMAAAGIVQLMGGTARQAIGAASMAIQNMIGLICDPVADRVEVPCLGKNTSAAMNALSSATMARAGFDAVIPLQEVIQTVSTVSQMMPSCNKCTGKGGLAITPTSMRLKNQLKINTAHS